MDNKYAPVSKEWLESMLIRWRMSQQLAAALREIPLTEAAALRYFLDTDIPLLLSELTRMRSQLGTGS